MLMPLFEYVENLHLGNALDDTGYLVAFINVSHLLALTVFGAGAAMLRLVQRSDIDYARRVFAQVRAAVGCRPEKPA